jgi:NADPH2:quinone reductase
MTAALGLYSSVRLGLPEPWHAASSPIPLIVYGASSAVVSTVSSAYKVLLC